MCEQAVPSSPAPSGRGPDIAEIALQLVEVVYEAVGFWRVRKWQREREFSQWSLLCTASLTSGQLAAKIVGDLYVPERRCACLRRSTSEDRTTIWSFILRAGLRGELLLADRLSFLSFETSMKRQRRSLRCSPFCFHPRKPDSRTGARRTAHRRRCLLPRWRHRRQDRRNVPC